MDAERFDRWSRSLAAARGRTLLGALPSLDVSPLARVLGTAASRRSVLGGLLAALLAPRIPFAEAVARQETTCQGSDCPCPCADPPCFLRAWGGGDFVVPNGVAAAPDGTVYVSESLNRILSFDAAGTFLGAWGSEGSGEGQFSSPAGVAVAPDGTVYVADTGNHRIQVFTADGAFIAVWGGFGSRDGEF